MFDYYLGKKEQSLRNQTLTHAAFTNTLSGKMPLLALPYTETDVPRAPYMHRCFALVTKNTQETIKEIYVNSHNSAQFFKMT